MMVIFVLAGSEIQLTSKLREMAKFILDKL